MAHTKATVLTTGIVLACTLAACGGGSSMNTDQKQAASRMQSEGGFSGKDADCIAKKLSGDALDLVRRDPDFSDLTQDTTAGPKVAAAFESCTGKNFENTYHYNPADDG